MKTHKTYFRSSRIILIAVVFMASILFSFAVLNLYLNHSLSQTMEGFKRQNLLALSSGDVLSVSSKLDALSTMTSWECIEGVKEGENFYLAQKGPCSSSPFRAVYILDMREQGGIFISMTLSLPDELLWLSYIFLFFNSLFLAIILWLYRSVEKQKAERVRQETSHELRFYSAIAQTTQMLAHDVRKPFSLLKMGLSRIASEKEAGEIRSVAQTMTAEVERSVASVDGLIRDVMEIGAQKKPDVEEYFVEELLQSAVESVFDIWPSADVEVEYDLAEGLVVEVEKRKIQRAFNNIIDNAVQAMKGSGRIWFVGRPLNGGVEIRIGNSGTYIDTKDMPQLFEAFYTKGKKGGTGLGLAIAEKVVKDHGGKIWCESSRDVGTEFVMWLPGGITSRGVAKQVETVASVEAPVVLLVEDDIFVRESWQVELEKGAEVHVFSSPEELFAKFEIDNELMNRTSLVITDFHFDDSSEMDGHDLALRLRELVSHPIVLCSNGEYSDDIRREFSAVISKDPVSYSALKAGLNC